MVFDMNTFRNRLILLFLIIFPALNSCEDSVPTAEEILLTVEVSPNPFHDSIEIVMDSRAKGDLFYQVFNMSGGIMKSDELMLDSTTPHTILVDLSKLEVGLYLLKLEYDDASVAKRLIKQDKDTG